MMPDLSAPTLRVVEETFAPQAVARNTALDAANSLKSQAIGRIERVQVQLRKARRGLWGVRAVFAVGLAMWCSTAIRWADGWVAPLGGFALLTVLLTGDAVRKRCSVQKQELWHELGVLAAAEQITQALEE